LISIIDIISSLTFSRAFSDIVDPACFQLRDDPTEDAEAMKSNEASSEIDLKRVKRIENDASTNCDEVEHLLAQKQIRKASSVL
jgi:hypothetical protein